MLTYPEKFTKVTGTILQMEADLTTDPDDKPGTSPISADVYFTPNVGKGDLFHLPALPSSDPEVAAPQLRAPKPIKAKLIAGVLTDITGNPYIQLWAADSHTVPSELSYEVSFKNIQANGSQINDIAPFSFTAVPDAVIDLASVARVPNSPGPMARGERGVGIEDIVELDGILTISMDDGSEYVVPLPGLTSALDGAIAARDAAVAARNTATGAATAASGSATAAAGSATAADGSKTAAAGSATAAAGSATAADGSKTAAAGSATAAGTAKTAAETARDAAVAAKTASETAKTASETARDAAVAAKTASETAKTASEGARDTSVSAKNTAVTAKDDAVTAKNAAQQAVADANAMIIPDNSISAPKLDSTLAARVAKADTAVQPATLTGYAPLVGGIVPQANMPAVAVVDFLGAVANQAAMLALVGQRGDWCTRNDLGTDWQVIAEPSSSLANWRERTYPASPVSSVAGRVGAVTLAAADITDSTTVGRALMKAADAAAGRTAIGAGTSSLALGSTSTTALRGDAQQYGTSLPGSGAFTGAVFHVTET